MRGSWDFCTEIVTMRPKNVQTYITYGCTTNLSKNVYFLLINKKHWLGSRNELFVDIDIKEHNTTASINELLSLTYISLIQVKKRVKNSYNSKPHKRVLILNIY